MKLAITILLVSSAYAQRGGGAPPSAPLASLKTVPKPTIAGLDRYVENTDALVLLGKAFFWDMQAGSDGRTACASCHFHAGGDHRVKHQLKGDGAPTNYTLTAGDFPFRRLANPNNNQSQVLRDNRYVAGSAGVHLREFQDVTPGSEIDSAIDLIHSAATGSSVASLRQVTGRNTPTVINAVFNVRNFWDGRARNVYTGTTPFGESDPGAHVWVWRDGQLGRESILLENASLASQATGPVLDKVEMSWMGRTWSKLGRKMLSLAPLARQRVAADDSVLGSLASESGFGLREGVTYRSLIRSAFRSEFTNAPVGAEDYDQMELNFPLFWALSIQAYQSTLVSDDSPVDRFLEGNRSALTALEQQGLQEFQGPGSQCAICHGGPELTAAAFTSVSRRPNNGDPNNLGFFRIGVSPIDEDLGLGGTDGLGFPLLVTNRPGAANGTFKAPTLRNVELTGPYFHNGSQATLEQVVDFYARNGDIPAGGNLGPGIGAIRLGGNDRAALVAFLKALTDERVKYQRAPFDHPSLCVPHGVNEAGVEEWKLVPQTGQGGAAAPLQTFDEMLRGIGNDGSRANSLTEACVL